MSKSIKITLILSVALNLLLVGMLSGRLCQHFMGPKELPSLHELVMKLPEGKRDLVENTMRDALEDVDKTRAQLANDKKEAIHVLTSEPFNESAYLTQIQHISDLHTQMKRHLAETVAGLAKQLTADERAVLGEIISRPPPPLAGTPVHP